MRLIYISIGVVVFTVILVLFLQNNSKIKNSDSTSGSNITKSTSDSSKTEVIASGLDTPWALIFLPDNSILLTERAGRVKIVKEGKLQEAPVGTLNQVREIGEGGLLGIDIDPDFKENKFVYLYYTYSQSGNNTLNKVSRFKFEDNLLKDEEVIVENIPGAANHNGGRIKFGPDKFLYITTGDAQDPSKSQDKNSLAGKILRVSRDKKVEVYSLGHRNPQGIAWDSMGNLWSTEHGPSGLQTGNDEVNLIIMGQNYGWPEIQGDQIKDNMRAPVKHSGLTSTWAPGGAVFYKNSLFFTGLRGQALYEAVVENNQIKEFKEHFKGEFGRIRDVILGPDQKLYITTSNLDGRGTPKQGDDKVIRISPEGL